ncbi:hypothetical protein BKA93DRAFT_845543 [Sparassis latifolia]
MFRLHKKPETLMHNLFTTHEPPYQLRERIAYWYYHDRLPVVDIVQLSGYQKSAIYDVLQLYREYGQVTNPLALPRGRPRALDENDIAYLSALIDMNAAIYLDEIQDKFTEDRDIDVSLATISHALLTTSL